MIGKKFLACLAAVGFATAAMPAIGVARTHSTSTATSMLSSSGKAHVSLVKKGKKGTKGKHKGKGKKHHHKKKS